MAEEEEVLAGVSPAVIGNWNWLVQGETGGPGLPISFHGLWPVTHG